RPDELAVGRFAGRFQYLYAAKVMLLGGRVVLEAIVCGREVRQRIHQRTIVRAVLLFRELYQLFREGERFLVVPRVELRPEALIDLQAIRIRDGAGELRSKRKSRHRDPSQKHRVAILTLFQRVLREQRIERRVRTSRWISNQRAA